MNVSQQQKSTAGQVCDCNNAITNICTSDDGVRGCTAATGAPSCTGLDAWLAVSSGARPSERPADPCKCTIQARLELSVGSQTATLLLRFGNTCVIQVPPAVTIGHWPLALGHLTDNILVNMVSPIGRPPLWFSKIEGVSQTAAFG